MLVVDFDNGADKLFEAQQNGFANFRRNFAFAAVGRLTGHCAVNNAERNATVAFVEVRQTGTARREGVDAMWQDNEQAQIIVKLIYNDFDAHKLLFCKSDGTKYENYLHSIVTKVQEATLSFKDELEANGVHVNKVDEKEMHLILSAQYTAMLEMVYHDFSYEEAIHYSDTISEFFKEGWRKYLGF